MPSFTSPLDPDGLVADVLVFPNAAIIQSIKSSGGVPPAPLKVRALLDTGASGTSVNPAIVASLGLNPVGSVLVSTPTTQTPVPCNLVSIDLFFISSQTTITNIVATETPLGGQGIQMLIGRDVLKHGVLIYTGYINQFTLSF